MVKPDYRELLSQVIGLLDTACQASLELMEHCANGETDAAAELLSDLQAVAQAAGAAQEPLLPQLEHAYTAEMLENIQDTLDDIERAIQADDQERAAVKMEFQLFPFLRQLRESFYFWGAVYPDRAEMERYYREEFAEHSRNLYVSEEQAPEFQLSIVVPAYNHLETTKRCVSRILEETDFEKLNAELILIDHGSTDGTLEYFESLGVGKVIHFKKNVRMYMFVTMLQVCQGEYFAFVSNDVLVTKDWAELLLRCMESDPRIAVAVPATPNISNLQAVGLPNLDADSFISWADKQNRHEPSCWNERARIMPPLGMYRTGTASALGFADPAFYSMEFWDDDFSLRVRRAGYRQLVCDDVACYHFGSVTGGDAQRKESTLVYGRELFRQKHGIDAWGTGFCYDYQAVRLLLKVLPAKGDLNILGLDCGMGDTPLQIRNELRHRGQEGRLYQLTGQKQYLPDLTPHSTYVHFVPDLAGRLQEYFGETAFHCIYLGQDIGQYGDYDDLLKAVSQRLAPDGCVLFSCANPFYAWTLHAFLQFSFPDEEARCVLTNIERLRQTAERYFARVQIVGLEQSINGLNEFAERHFGTGEHLKAISQRLCVQQYYFLCGGGDT